MNKSEIEQLAIGIDTGKTDRNGNPIRVGDEIVIYHRCTKYIGQEMKNGHNLLVDTYDDKYIVGTGAQGYVYSGKIQRQRYKVTFSFENGVAYTPTNKRKFLEDKDSKGNLKYVLVVKDNNVPKLTFEELESEG